MELPAAKLRLKSVYSPATALLQESLSAFNNGRYSTARGGIEAFLELIASAHGEHVLRYGGGSVTFYVAHRYVPGFCLSGIDIVEPCCQYAHAFQVGQSVQQRGIQPYLVDQQNVRIQGAPRCFRC